MSDSSIINVECVVIATVLKSLWLTLLARSFRRRGRAKFAIGKPVAVGYGVRLIAIAGVSATGIGSSLRGADELGFLSAAHRIATSSFTSGLWFPGGKTPTQPFEHYLHDIVPAIQMKTIGLSDGSVRIAQVGIAMTGLVLIFAVYDLAGARAARLAAWLLAIEPASAFFNGLVHKGAPDGAGKRSRRSWGTKVWKGLSPMGILLLGTGSLVAVSTRPYVGWFLAAASVLLILHASLRQFSRLRSIPLVYGVIIAIVVATPTVLQATSSQYLSHGLQTSQNADTNPNRLDNTAPTSSETNGNNLARLRSDDMPSVSVVVNSYTTISVPGTGDQGFRAERRGQWINTGIEPFVMIAACG